MLADRSGKKKVTLLIHLQGLFLRLDRHFSSSENSATLKNYH